MAGRWASSTQLVTTHAVASRDAASNPPDISSVSRAVHSRRLRGQRHVNHDASGGSIGGPSGEI